MGHNERSHALLSASGAHRWISCPPSALLGKDIPDISSDAAQEGTLAHELAEAKVRHYFYEADFSKRKLTSVVNKLKKNEFWQEEMQGYTDVYLDYIKSVALALDSPPYVAIEKKVNFSQYVPEGFGTADCIMVYGDTLHVVDFKYGKSPNGKVSAELNPQLMLYALGAYEAYKILYQINRVKLTIVQPRLPEGISEWECSISELLVFGEYASERAKLALSGAGEFNPSGDNCKYCKIRNSCRARAEKNMELHSHIEKKPPLLNADEIGEYLSKGEDVAKWLKDLQEFALNECLAGKEVPGWKAVEGRGVRAWTDSDKAFDTLISSGIDETLLYERKQISLAQAEKVVGKGEFNDLVGDFVIKAPGKPALVKSTDKRNAITNKISAKEAFKEDL